MPKKKKAKTPQTELPELVAVMLKVAERLESLEKKMELVLSQTSVRHAEVRHAPQPSQPQHPQHQGQRTLYQAVCADCRKPCEVPFKPTGERPVYCKECFAQRKAAKKNNHYSREAVPQRQVRVIPNGAGKVTISEVVHAAARQPSTKKSRSKPAKKKRA